MQRIRVDDFKVLHCGNLIMEGKPACRNPHMHPVFSFRFMSFDDKENWNCNNSATVIDCWAHSFLHHSIMGCGWVSNSRTNLQWLQDYPVLRSTANYRLCALSRPCPLQGTDTCGRSNLGQKRFPVVWRELSEQFGNSKANCSQK